MMKKLVATGLGITGLVMLAWSAFFTVPAEGSANIVAVEGVAYNVNHSIADNLKSLVGKKVYVTIASGKTFAGIVKTVGDNLIHLEKLDDKDFFDALIRIEDISAIDTKFRDFQR